VILPLATTAAAESGTVGLSVPGGIRAWPVAPLATAEALRPPALLLGVVGLAAAIVDLLRTTLRVDGDCGGGLDCLLTRLASELDRPLTRLALELDRLAEQHEAYPVLQRDHGERAGRSSAMAVATFDESTTVSDEAFAAAVADVRHRRRQLRGAVAADAWHWPPVNDE